MECNNKMVKIVFVTTFSNKFCHNSKFSYHINVRSATVETADSNAAK